MYEWGWFEIVDGELGEEHIEPGKNEWYCRFEGDGHLNPDQYNYFVKTYNSETGCSTRSFYNMPLDPVGTIENELESILIYPNPTGGLINVNLGSSFYGEQVTISLFDFTGQQLFSRRANIRGNNNTIVIDKTRELQPGVYIIRIKSSDKHFHSKIIVK
jgi:hypothetical protein